MSPLQNHYRRFARYNAWANKRIYDAAFALPEADYYAERASFFGSLHNTLNHILVADRIWMGRFTGTPTPELTRLNLVLFDQREPLRAARAAEDARILAYIDGLSDAALNAEIGYRNMAGKDFRDPLAPLLAHFFNHQTHHRGQAHGLLSAARPGVEPPSLDMIVFQREVPA